MTDPRDDVARYAAAVRAALADLDPTERTQLLDDLEGHLAEVAAESDVPLEERLGPPAAYAAELSAAYGAGARTSWLERLVAARHRTGPRRLSRRWRLACLALFAVIGAAVVATFIAESGQLSGSEGWSNSQLVAQARAGHVRSVDVSGASVVATDRAGVRHDVTGMSSFGQGPATEMVHDGVEVTYSQPGSALLPLATLLPNLLLLTIIAAMVVLLLRVTARPRQPARR